ncbi:DEAD/DEAH box helicase [Natrarchaeobaculum sulfurireducens]|uniref:ATP-dependent helicase YprA n=1 Tax=Natrarchaeobaculum sulfurireducens TaxID=2044521 RepID=A0A346P9D4_9EURY|nr:DEAD/DEAH box helicase [Natrarchaeobaculum sulfurireducens]AXR76129.1 ATP-dependent helicase YprA [Natrarchaeobaculum sulfurireducens]
MSIEDTIEWLKDRPYYEGQIIHQERTPGTSAETAPINLDDRLARALSRRNINEPFQHQADAIETIRDGGHVVLATPTASGKSLAYTVPALERALDHHGKTLYIAPMNALINDQKDTISNIAEDLNNDRSINIATYTGLLTDSEKREVWAQQPDILLTTPDMIHKSFLPYSKSPKHWKWLFQQLETIVIDEVHEFRGIFGSHVSLVFRRLSRLAEYYDSTPQYICCSATIGNPIEHAASVTGQPSSQFTLIDDDASATGPRHWIFWNPPIRENEEHDPKISTADGLPSTTDRDPKTGQSPTVPVEVPHHNEIIGGERRSHHPETVQLFCDLVQRGYQTLVFTRARQGTEQYANWCDSKLRKRGEHELADQITAYHSALPDKRRTTIEAGLRDGSIRGVWSTNALELGIDIGSLDVVLLDGHPGTNMSTFQRAGRAGRGESPSLVALVASPNPLDQYCMANPDRLFDGDPEQAAVNPSNTQILDDHVCCAAQELFLGTNDESYFGDEYPTTVASLDEENQLERFSSRTGPRWKYIGEDSPQHTMDIRSIDDRQIDLYDRLRDKTLTSLPFGDALRDAHPGAIYHHQKETYRVTEADFDADRVLLKSVNTMGYTRPLTEKQIMVKEELKASKLASHKTISVGFADITVAEKVTGYMLYDHPSDEDGVERDFDEPLPERTIHTRGLYFTIPSQIEEDIKAVSEKEDGFLASIHALEHALISLFPLEILCARRDVGGLSTEYHPHTGQSTIFVHDGHPGGVGLSQEAFGKLETMLKRTLEMLRSCPCEDGCPSCVHSPQCGNANRTLNKQLAVRLVEQLLEVPVRH